ncbi:hypothetical protein ABER99_21355 [Paenibacillus glucanolyticus]|jgi:hypothetical protein|uniref:Uncharacterized protein n=1 Tax=Paenibacillus glucanolyticus TaxID=59843 RepID=A0A163G683_9BACL|nr:MULTISPECIES: hypothetical protein [Paenibacillus]KZS44756.1 hypothetical protein AWU65_01835 [Paenibacillus glucanolyticus]MDH6675650.1 hypothetical protein [Paenibacillus sp. LBL]OMF64747.1 hypothetical protein BK142_31670 [Paenibacillus glucanolyticus]
MNKKFLRRTIIIASCCFVLMSAFFIIRELIDNKQVIDSTINDTTPPKKALPDWQIEYDRKARTEPVESVATEHGEFYYAPFPKQFPREEVVRGDIGEEVTEDTKQLIIRGYYYEKK